MKSANSRKTLFGEYGWLSGESAYLPPKTMWPGFDSVLVLVSILSWSHIMLVEFIDDSHLALRAFLQVLLVFLPPENPTFPIPV